MIVSVEDSLPTGNNFTVISEVITLIGKNLFYEPIPFEMLKTFRDITSSYHKLKRNVSCVQESNLWLYLHSTSWWIYSDHLCWNHYSSCDHRNRFPSAKCRHPESLVCDDWMHDWLGQVYIDEHWIHSYEGLNMRWRLQPKVIARGRLVPIIDLVRQSYCMFHQWHASVQCFESDSRWHHNNYWYQLPTSSWMKYSRTEVCRYLNNILFGSNDCADYTCLLDDAIRCILNIVIGIKTWVYDCLLQMNTLKCKSHIVRAGH